MALKTMIIGWDGATFDVIAPLVKSGRMPNVASIMSSGAWGRLESTMPPLTPVAWTSIITGVNPGKHGIYDAVRHDPATHRFSFVTTAARRVNALWSILSERGYTVGAMNVPVTYPADEVKGFAIPGMLTPVGSDDFIYPKGLKDELDKKFGSYMVECAQLENPAAYLKEILGMIEQREKAALYLMDRYPLDFFFLVFMASDRVQHFYWKYLDPNHPDHSKYGEAVAIIYERLDKALGALIKKAGPETSLMMVSDHGAGPLHSTFFLNNWLMRKGYLKLTGDPASVMKAKRPSMLKTGIARSIKSILPDSMLKKIRPGRGPAPDNLSAFTSIIDWDNTKAFSEGLAGGIYVNNHKVKPEERDRLLSEITRGLYEVKDPQGRQVIEAVYRREEIYKGETVQTAPDLVAICTKGYQIISPNEMMYFNEDYVDTLFLPHKWSGRHEQYGIFLLSGPSARKGVEVNDARIIDMTPTALYLMGEPIPEYMDGQVLASAIDPDYMLKHQPSYTKEAIGEGVSARDLSEEEEKEIAEKLKGLGYLE